MKKRWRDFGIGISVANLLLLVVWPELLFTNTSSSYYMLSPPAASDYIAAVANTIVLGTLLFGVVQIIRLAKKGWLTAVTGICFVGALLIALNMIRFQFTNFGIGVLLARLKQTSMIIPFIIVCICLTVIAIRFRQKIVRILTIFVLFLLPLAAITTGYALIKAMSVKHPDQGTTTRLQLKEVSREGPRVVWIIFDELDDRIIFMRRPSGLFLPTLDLFRQKAVKVYQAKPPSNRVMVSIPALLTGMPLTESHPQGPGELTVIPQGKSRSVSLSALPNVFSRAREAGFHTTAVGWYHPYCRLFRNSLDSCAWQPGFQTITGQIPNEEKSISNAMQNQLASIYPFNRRRLAIHAYKKILQDSKKALENGSGLIFLHFPIPHSPVIYNLDSERLTTTAISNVQGYVDNLALVDSTFRQLQQTLEERGVWDETAVIISSDNPWRDAKVFSGKQIPFVPFLLKMPHQNSKTDLDIPFQTVKTADMVLAILKKEITNDAEATAWIQSHSK